MPNQYSLQIIHPSFELLKRSSKILHFIAASLILLNALQYLQITGYSKTMCYMQLIIAVDIYLLVFLGSGLITDSPAVNLIFRLIEFVTLFGTGLTLLGDQFFIIGSIHVLFAIVYAFVLYRERRVLRSESIDIRQTGITIPNFLQDEEISWPDVKTVEPKYHSVIIETFRNKTIQFKLRRNLKIEEMQQIDDFCKQHLPVG